MAYNPQNPNGSATSANSSPVVIASDQAAIPITDNAGSITVDGTVTANAGTGSFTVAQATAGNLNATVTGSVTVSNFPATQPISGTIAATQSGTWNVGLSTGANAIGSITNTSFAATQATAASLLNKPYGAVTTAAPTYTTGTDNALSLTTAGALRIDGSAVTQPVSGTFWQATQPVSGTITANIGTSGSLALDATLTGGTQRTKITDGTTNAAVKAASTAAAATDPALVVAVSPNNSVAVTGTFWQTTQPISGSVTLNGAALLADGSTNPTTLTVGADNAFYNGTTWDRARSTDALLGAATLTTTGIQAAGIGPGFSNRYASASLGTTVGSISLQNTNGAMNMSLMFAVNSLTGSFVIEGSVDGTQWTNEIEVFNPTINQWVSGQTLTVGSSSIYLISCANYRVVRLRVTVALSGALTHTYTGSLGHDLLSAISTGYAPHNLGVPIWSVTREYTAAVAGVTLYTPATGKKFVVTDITISTFAQTAGVISLYDAVAATTTLTFTSNAPSSPVVFRGSFLPTATSQPGISKSFRIPYVSASSSNVLHLLSSAAISFTITVSGYDIL